MQAQQRPNHDVQAFFFAHHFVQWRLCVGDLRVCRVTLFVSQQTVAILLLS